MMGWLITLLVLGALAYGVRQWWVYSTVLPEGYSIEGTGGSGFHKYVLYRPDEDHPLVYSDYTDLFGLSRQYRKLVRVANTDVRNR